MTTITAAQFRKMLRADSTGASLPAGLTVGGSLYLSGCTGLTALPAGLTVGGSLYLSGCTGLTTLPAGLTVNGSLDLYGCTGLTALPDGLTAGGALDLRGCTGLTNVIRGGTDARGYAFFGYRDAKRGFRVIAGCRNFSPDEARAHWPEGSECRVLAEGVIAREGELA